MAPLIVSVFLASVVGGLHCAGMCGGLMAFALGSGPKRSAAPHLLYHGGRMISYVALGAAAGAMGSLLNLGGTLVGLANVALVGAAVLMIAVGLATLVRAAGVRMSCGGGATEGMAKLAARVQGRAIRLPVQRRALLMGLATPLLPCGWLYAFVITAAGTGSAWRAALVMLVFWAGTLPAMATLGLGVRALAGRLGPKLPVVTSLLLVLAGGWTLVARAGLNPATLARQADAASSPQAAPDPDDVPACCRVNPEAQ